MPLDFTDAQKRVAQEVKDELGECGMILARMVEGLEWLLTLDEADDLVEDDLDPGVVLDRAKARYMERLTQLQTRVAGLPTFSAG